MDQHIVIVLYQWAAARPLVSHLAALIAEDGVALLPLLLAVVWLWPGADGPERRSVLLACAISFALALAAVLYLDASHVIQRTRPFVALAIRPLVSHAADSSFPSDHTLLGTALIGPLLWRRPRLGVWPFLWVLVIGVARVAVGIHYPTDILGSVVLGVVPTAIGLLVAPRLAGMPIVRTLISTDLLPSRR